MRDLYVLYLVIFRSTDRCVCSCVHVLLVCVGGGISIHCELSTFLDVFIFMCIHLSVFMLIHV